MKKLVPAFLKRLDKYLLLHQPEIWISKIHYVVFYCLLIFVAVFGFTYILEVQKNDVPTYELAWAFLSLPLLVGLVIWIRKVVQYNPIREFPQTNIGAEYKLLMAVFIGFLMFFLIPFGSTSAGKLKVNAVISDVEYKTDSLAFERVKFLFENNITITEEDDEYVITKNSRNYSFFEERLTKDKDVLIHYLEEFKRVYFEYSKNNNYSYDPNFEKGNGEYLYHQIFIERNNFNIHFWDTEKGLRTVRGYKKGKVFPFELIITVVGLSTVFALLLYGFKNSRKKDFLFAVIGLVLLPEVMGFVGFVFALVSGFQIDKDHVLFFCFFLPYVVLFVFVIQGSMALSYKKKYGIALIMTHLLLLGLPLILLGWYDESAGVRVEDSTYQVTVLLSTIGVLLLTPILFKPLYKYLYAMPES